MTAGIDEPDRRGRTGLDRVYRDLIGNDGVRVRGVELLASDWYVLRRTTFDLRHRDGSWSTEQLHCYAGSYDAATRTTAGGGLAEEGEDIEVVELDVDEALAQVGTGIVDAKTVLLLQWAVLSGPFAR